MVDLRKSPFNLDDSKIAWVERTLSSMTIDEKIGQLFTVCLSAGDEDRLSEYLHKYHVGGALLRCMNARNIADIVNTCAKDSRIPVVFAANLESGGDGLASEGTKVGCPMSIAAGSGVKGAADMGRIAGSEAKALGVTWSFAPVADIDLNFRNPITNTRTFGSDASLVSDCVSAYVRSCQACGVAASVKHFPGDGCDERDQHLVASVNDLSVEQWKTTYGRIYKRAIDEGVMTIMAGHIMQPAWTRFLNPGIKDEDIMPGSLSKELLQGLLRERLGFNGVVTTDSTLMVGFNSRLSRRLAVPSCIEAGADMFLFARDIEEDFAYMKEGYLSGILSQQRLDDALLRILGMKAALGLSDGNVHCNVEQALELMKEHKAELLLERTARASITLVKDKGGVLPVSVMNNRRVLMYGLAHSEDDRKPVLVLADKLRKKGFEVDMFEPDLSCNPVGRYDLVFFCAHVPVRSNQTVARFSWQTPVAYSTPVFSHEVPTLFVSLGNPYHLLDAPMVGTYINCYQSEDEVLDVLVEKMLGESPFEGVSPVDAFCGKWDTGI